MAKKILIDGLGLVDGHFSGVGQYILGILRGIDEIIDEQKLAGSNPPDVKVVIPYDSLAKFRSFGFKHIGYKRLPLKFRHVAALWHRSKMPPIDLWCGKGFYIFPRFVSMPLMFSKSANVVYDISFELYRQYSDEKNAAFLSEAVKKTLQKTTAVITISENAKKEIVDFYKFPEAKVAIAAPAVDQSHFYKRSQLEIDEVKRKYKIKGDYIMTLSNLEPRKNLDGLVDAYCSLPKSITDKVGLLLVGVSGWKTEALFEKIIGKVTGGYNIIRPSQYVKDADKPALISGAKLLVYPSHYEGFGMPPLEALACGVPVVTSDNSSLPEVVGSTGTMVSSTNTPELTKAIVDSLAGWDLLSEKVAQEGPTQARKFSWRKSAQVFIDVADGAQK